MAFWVLFDHLGKLILANMLWAISIAIPGSFAATAMLYGDAAVRLWIGLPLTVLTFGVVVPVMSSGLAHMLKVLIDRKDGALSDMIEGIRTYGRRAACIGLAYMFAGACLGTSVWFYTAKLQTSAPFLGYVIGALALWCLVFLGLTALYVLPALVQKREPAIATLKLSALLVLDNPLLTIGLAVQVAVITAVSATVWPLAVVFYGVAVLALGSSAYELMARKYAALDANMGGGNVPPLDDKDDDYLNRGVRDVFFPWKG
jgi:uncharacterized membrane protein YesL